ncbi:MAG: YbaB/EbfC family nucleoid-associated protein [Deltaproteobacteria bacterium]|nr:YbaB/EbfC family nucleoid-associated protein [Deltaproteobacteria bacterium]
MPGIDINYFIRQANKLTEKIEQRKKALAEETLEGNAGGLVTAVVNGVQELKSIRIDPKALEGGDRAMLEDLVVAAVNQAMENSRTRMKQELEKVSGGVKIPGLT